MLKCRVNRYRYLGHPVLVSTCVNKRNVVKIVKNVQQVLNITSHFFIIQIIKNTQVLVKRFMLFLSNSVDFNSLLLAYLNM